jgi:integrase
MNLHGNPRSYEAERSFCAPALVTARRPVALVCVRQYAKWDDLGMSQTQCPFADLTALRDHAERCPECAGKNQKMVTLATQILLAAATTIHSHTNAESPNIFILNTSGLEGGKDQTDQNSPTFAEFVEQHFEPGVLRYMLTGGRKSYSYMLKRYILPELGTFQLSEITFDLVQNLVQKMLDGGYAVQTAKHVRQITNCVFKHAVRTGHFQGPIPTSGIRFPAMVCRERRALTIDQAKQVLQVLKKPYRQMALISMTTSMNLAELCALRWKRVNLTGESILSEGEVIPPHSVAVRESYYEGSFGPPKTHNRKRFIPLTQAGVTALETLKQASRFSGPDDIVFATKNGTPKRSSNLRHQVIKPAGKKINLPWLNWHAFRYTFATIGEQLGISLSDRQAQMGHGTKWMTQEYTVSNFERRRAGAELIAEKIASTQVTGRRGRTW